MPQKFINMNNLGGFWWNYLQMSNIFRTFVAVFEIVCQN